VRGKGNNLNKVIYVFKLIFINKLILCSTGLLEKMNAVFPLHFRKTQSFIRVLETELV
jgi:hypothetical protein